MGPISCGEESWNCSTSRYALCSSIRYNIKTTYGLEFPPATGRQTEIPPFYGKEDERVANRWISMYESWALQESLNRKKKVQLVLLGMFDEAYMWVRELDIEKAKWREFVRLFRERYVGDPTPWSGSPKFPYWLYFSGTARPVVGQAQGQGGIGIVLVSPLQELQVATVSRYLGRHCSVHVAEYMALIMGLETALHRGVKHLTVMCDSMTVFNQVTGKWAACHSSIYALKNEVEKLLLQFKTCGTVLIHHKHNAQAQCLANTAIECSKDHNPISRREGFKPISMMAVLQRLKRNPLPVDRKKKFRQSGCHPHSCPVSPRNHSHRREWLTGGPSSSESLRPHSQLWNPGHMC